MIGEKKTDYFVYIVIYMIELLYLCNSQNLYDVETL